MFFSSFYTSLPKSAIHWSPTQIWPYSLSFPQMSKSMLLPQFCGHSVHSFSGPAHWWSDHIPTETSAAPLELVRWAQLPAQWKEAYMKPHPLRRWRRECLYIFQEHHGPATLLSTSTCCLPINQKANSSGSEPWLPIRITERPCEIHAFLSSQPSPIQTESPAANPCSWYKISREWPQAPWVCESETLEGAPGCDNSGAENVPEGSSQGACQVQDLALGYLLLVYWELLDPLPGSMTCGSQWSCSAGVALLGPYRKSWVPWDSQSSWKTELPSGKSQDNFCSCQTHPINMEVTDSLQHINKFCCQKFLSNSDVRSLEGITPQKQGYKWRLVFHVVKLRGCVTHCILHHELGKS